MRIQAYFDEVRKEGVTDRSKELPRQLDTSKNRESNWMAAVQAMREEMLDAVPKLRAFAIPLCRNVDRADDLVQETLLRAIDNIDSFQPGTNMSVWLFTILCNLFRSEHRKRRREVEEPDVSYADTWTSSPKQQGRLEFEELRVALGKLAPVQREAIILVGASGFSYREAAAICECAVGTIKSRVSRARMGLAELLATNNINDVNPNRTSGSVRAADDSR